MLSDRPGTKLDTFVSDYVVCLNYAKEKKVEKIIIVSNKKCVQALHLYRKYGFDEVPVNKEKFPFERADIAFEMLLEK